MGVGFSRIGSSLGASPNDRASGQPAPGGRDHASAFHHCGNSPASLPPSVWFDRGTVNGVRRKLESVLRSLCRSDPATSIWTSCHRTLLRVALLGHEGDISHLAKKFSLTPEGGKRERLR